MGTMQGERTAEYEKNNTLVCDSLLCMYCWLYTFLALRKS